MDAITTIRRNTVVAMLEAYAKKKGYTFGVFNHDTKGLLDELRFVRFDRSFMFAADWNALIPNAYDNFEYIRKKVEEALEPKPAYDVKLYKEAMDWIKKDVQHNLYTYTHRKPLPPIEKVIHNDPATIVFWADKTKTVVKAGPKDIFDPEKGLAMAIAKKALGNQGNYYNTIKKWLPEEKEPEFMSLTDLIASIIKVDAMLREVFGDTINGSDEEVEEEPAKPEPEERPYYVWFRGPDTTAWTRYNYAYKRKYSAERYAKKHFPDDWSWIVSRDYIWTKDDAADETPEDYTWDYLSGDKE